MIRIKLFALFIAFALLALVRPRKCLELLEAADRGVARAPAEERVDFEKFWTDPHHGDNSSIEWREGDGYFSFLTREAYRAWLARAQLAQEYPLPPAGWRCTRRAGHDGPCAAVAK